MTDPWAVALMIQMSRFQYLRLGPRPASVSDWQALLAWSQEMNGWVTVIGGTDG